MIKRVFLDWMEPAVTASTRGLLSMDAEKLSRALLIVPTKSSAVKLRRELIRLSPGGALLLPEILTAEQLLERLFPAGDETATPCETLAAWCKMLEETDLTNFPSLFGTEERQKSFSRLFSSSEQFLSTRNILMESGLDFSVVADRMAQPDPELAALLPPNEYKRWRELAVLADRVSRKLRYWGKADRADLLREGIPSTPQKTSLTVLLCHPDPLPRILPILDAWAAKGLDTQTWIQAPEDFASSFDRYGRPVISEWEQQPIPLPGGNSCLAVKETPAEVAGEAIAHIARKNIGSDCLSLGVCDAQFTAPLQDAFREQGWTAYNAAGESPVKSIWARLPGLLSEAFRSPGKLAPVWELACSPLVQYALEMRNSYALAVALDRIKEEHLPETVKFTEYLLPHECREDFRLVSEWLRSLGEGGLCRQLSAFLDKVEASPLAESYKTDFMDAMRAALDAASPLEEASRITAPEELLLLIEKHLLGQKGYENPEDAHVHLENWLELGFSPEPHLLLIGLHEGSVPENKFSDPFLPERLKRCLNIRGTAWRGARDAYLMTALLNTRKTEGSVKIILSKYDSSGQPCLPSSLLMRCQKSELSDRINTLFPLDSAPRRIPASDRGNWTLSLPPGGNPWEDPERAFTPSRLKDFLTCPLRCWLRNIGGFERLELDASAQAHQMGNLIHKAVEQLGSRELRECSDPEKAASVLQEAFSAAFRKEFGEAVSLPLSVQYEFGLDRMGAVGRRHTDLVREGWRIIETERKVSGWELAPGFLLNMRLDCLQENDAGELRILDYKTGKRSKTPQKAHLESLSARKEEKLSRYLPEFPVFESGAFSRNNTPVRYRWADLQLPLYLLWARQTFPGKTVRTAYFNIPLNLDGIAVESWPALEDAALASAREWALCVMRLLRSGDFCRFPSAETLGWTTYPGDPFVKLGADGLEKAFFAGTTHLSPDATA